MKNSALASDNSDASYLFFTERKRKIWVKEYRNGKKKWVQRDFSPNLFVRDIDGEDAIDIYGHKLKRIHLDSISEARDFVKELDEASRDLFGYRKYETQFICSAGYRESIPDEYSIVYHDIETEVHDGFPDPSIAKEPINMITLLQRGGKRYALTTCEVKKEKIDKEFGIETMMFSSEAEMLRHFIYLFSEELETDIFVGWNSEKFDLPYIVNRIKRILGGDMAKKLSPFGEVYIRSFIDDFGDEAVTAEILGVSHVDMLQFYKKFSHESQESYSLDNIAKVELGVGKLTHESGIPGHLLYREYPTDGLRYNIVDVVRLEEIDEKKGIIDLAITVANMSKTNVSDTMFSTRLWMSMIYDYLSQRGRYFEFSRERNEYRKIEGGFVSCNSPGLHDYITSYDYASLYPSTMMALNIGVESKREKLEDVSPQFLLDNPDFKAPEGMAMGANGQCYAKDKKSFLNEIISHGYDLRKKYKSLKLFYQNLETKTDEGLAEAVQTHLRERKKDEALLEELSRISSMDTEKKRKEVSRLAKLYDSYDKSIKTILNSCYGALAEKNFFFYDPDMAESITLTGQFMVRNLGETFVKLLTKNFGRGVYLLNQDTDSCYLTLKAAVEKQFGDRDVSDKEKVEWLCKFADGPMKKVVQIANDVANIRLGSYEPERFDADREAVCRRGVFIQKKMYALAISDMEGVHYEKPKLKIVGLQAKKKSTPAFFRSKMEIFFNILLGEGDKKKATDHVINVESEFRNSPLDEIAGNFSVSDISSKMDDSEKGYVKGVHINARAAIVSNRVVESDEKARIYIEPIKNGDKIKMLPLRLPNPTKENIIAWKDEFPDIFRERKIDQYIDWTTHFQKAFMNPLKKIFIACQINPTRTEELDIF